MVASSMASTRTTRRTAKDPFTGPTDASTTVVGRMGDNTEKACLSLSRELSAKAPGKMDNELVGPMKPDILQPLYSL